MTFILLPETNKLNQWKKAVFSKSSSAYHQQGDHLVGSQCPGEPYVYKPCMCVHDQGKMTNWTLVTVSRAWQEINALSHLTPVFSTLFDSWRKVESFFFSFLFSLDNDDKNAYANQFDCPASPGRSGLHFSELLADEETWIFCFSVCLPGSSPQLDVGNTALTGLTVGNLKLTLRSSPRPCARPLNGDLDCSMSQLGNAMLLNSFAFKLPLPCSVWPGQTTATVVYN